MKQKPMEEILETCIVAITKYPPKNEHIEREMKELASSQEEKADIKRRKV